MDTENRTAEMYGRSGGILSGETELLTFDESEHIYREGSPYSGLYRVIEGRVKLYRKCNGREVIFDFAGRGDVIGMDVHPEEEICFSSAVAVEPSKLIKIEGDGMGRLIENSHSASLDYIKMLGAKIDRVESKTADMVFLRTNIRLARCLIDRFQDRDTGKVKSTLYISPDELADSVQASASYLVKLLSEFKKRKLIKLKRDRIEIADFEKLKEEAEGGGQRGKSKIVS